MDLLNAHTTVMTLQLSSIDDRYSCYRLIDPKSETAMAESMERYGQFSPIVVGEPLEERYLLVDGFKRLRACRELGCSQINASIFKAGKRALKAAMFHLNRQARTMAPLEEAMIIHGLYHDDKLTQEKIGTLLGFHKSWVCRRLSLLKRLDDEVLEQVRLGLIGPGITRELTKLPRGNQVDTLYTIRKHQMTCRESTQLVSLLQESPRWEFDTILFFPEPILAQREPDRPPVNKEFDLAFKELYRIKKRCAALLKRFHEKTPLVVPVKERSQVLELFSSIEGSLQGIKEATYLTESSDADF